MAIYTVDAGGNGADYTSIQAALDAAAATGDTIRIVGGGSYAEALVIDKSVTIEGIRAGEAAGSPEARDGGETMISGVTWTVTAADVVIDGLYFQKTTAGSPIVATGDNLTVVNSVLDGGPTWQAGDPGAWGIELGIGAIGATIAGNAIHGFSSGIYVNPTTGPLLIENNAISGNWAGIGSDGMAGATIRNNGFAGNIGEGIGASAVGLGNAVSDNSFDLLDGTNAVTNYGGAEIAASGNWVGTGDFRLARAAFEGDIAVTSYAASGVDTSAGAGFQPDPAALVNVIYDLDDNGDTPSGTGGDDWFVSAGGNDTVDGGAGNDTYDGSVNTNGIFVDLETGTAFGGAQTGTDTLISIENVAGGTGNDTILGDGGDNVIFASAGDDIIDGRGGNDTYDAGHLDVGSDITIDLTGGFAENGTAVGNDQLTDIENAFAGAGDDTLLGTAGDNLLVGGAGNDTVDGGGGSDTIDAGAGLDTVVFSGSYDAYTITREAATGDLLVENGGENTRVSGAEVLRFDDLDVHVVGGTSAITSIQTAVTAADGVDVVLVNPGVYAENVAIAGKSISLISTDGRDSTTIQGAAGGGLGTIFVSGATDGLRIGDAGAGFTVIGYDGPSPGIEHAAVYFQNAAGGHRNVVVSGNDIRAEGDGGLTMEYNANIDGALIDGNIFSGQTFVGDTLPAWTWGGGSYFSGQFTQANIPRQLVVIGGGAGTTNTRNITFTNNEVTGTAGALDGDGVARGNSLVTIDTVGGTIGGNNFTGFTYAAGLRARGPETDVTGNTFDNSGAGYTTGVFLQNADPDGDYSGNSFVGGDADADVWAGTPGADTMSGGDGGDAFIVTEAGFSGDQIDGGAGQDTLLVEGGGTVDMNDGAVSNIEAVVLNAPTAFTANDTAGLSITGSTGVDIVTLGVNGQSVSAGAGDDTIFVGAGADTVNGGTGADTVAVAENFDIATLTYDADSGNWLLAHNGETDTLTDVEAIQFADVKVWLADGANQTVQQAIGAAAGGVGDTAGDIVLMRDGVHSGDVTIDKSITLLGYGDTSTVLTGDGDAGTGIAVAADNVTVEGIGVTGYRYGIFVDTAIGGLTLDGVSASGNGGGQWLTEPAGLWVAGTGGIDGLTVTDSHFDNNAYGWVLQAAVGGPTVTNVQVSGTSFDGNFVKGLYAEKLNDATFDDIQVIDSGNLEVASAFFSGVLGGVDINLKFGDYENIAIQNSLFEDSGRFYELRDGVNYTGALTIKARDDGATYGANPATLDGVQILDNDFVNTGTYATRTELAIRIGETGQVNDGPTGVVVTGNTFDDIDVVFTNATAAPLDVAAILAANTVIGSNSAMIESDLAADIIVGSNVANEILGGTGDDLILGGGGDDVLSGGAGDDEMRGGEGDDTYNVDDAGDVVVEAADQGADTVVASVDHTLSANVENLTLRDLASNSEAFEDFTPGGIADGENGWRKVGGVSTEVVALGGAEGNVLVVANDPPTGDFGGPYTPALPATAGELSTTADANSMSFSLRFRPVQEAADGSRVEIDFANAAGTDRNNSLIVEHTGVPGTGLRIAVTEPGTTSGEWTNDQGLPFDFSFAQGYRTLAADIDPAAWHTLSARVTFGDGPSNDLIEVFLDGEMIGTSTTYENYRDFHVGQDHATAAEANQVSRVIFRTSEPTGNTFPADGSGGNRQGFYVDDIGYQVFDDLDGTGNELDNVLTGNSGSNALSGLAGNDTLIGGEGHDTLVGGLGDDAIDGGAGNDTIQYAVGDGQDSVDGGAGTDALKLSGTAAPETITVTAGSGAFTVDMDGAAGAELSVTDVEDLVIQTGDGGDIVQIDGDFAGTGIAASTITVIGGLDGDALDAGDAVGTGVVLDGGAGDDALTGGAGDDVLIGGAGDDEVAGGAGDDVLVLSGNRANYVIANNGDGTFTVSNAVDGVDLVHDDIETLRFDGDDATVSLSGRVELLKGGEVFETYDDISAALAAAATGDEIVLDAGVYAENISIGLGVTIRGANGGTAGNGTRGAESTITGTITINSVTGVTLDGVKLLDETPWMNSIADSRTALSVNGTGAHEILNSVFERAPTGTVNPNPNGFIGSGGAQTHRGITLAGGTTVDIEGNLFTGGNTYPYAGDTWRSAIYSNGGTHTISGNVFENSRTAINADDFSDAVTIEGNLFQATGTGVAVGVATSDLVDNITNNSFTNVDTEFNFRNLTVPIDFDLDATGNSGTDTRGLSVPEGAMLVLGGTGADSITGTAGNDWLVANDLTAQPDAGGTLAGLGGDDVLVGGSGNDVLDGGEGEDIVHGGDGDDTIVVTAAGIVGDAIDGGAGIDTLLVEGGGTVAMTDATVANVEIVELAEATTFTADATAGLIVEGSGDGDAVVLGDTGQTARGNGGDDTLTGGAGDDVLAGGAGSDSIEGGTGGDDVAEYAGPRSEYGIVKTAEGTFQVTHLAGAGADGVDTLTGVESVRFSDSAIKFELDANSPDYAGTRVRFDESFEDGSGGWQDGDTYGAIAVAASGDNGIESFDGASHAIFTETGGSGPFTRFHGYTGTWTGAWKTSTAVYLDTAWTDGQGFEYTVATSNDEGGHRRDFVFHVTRDSSAEALLVGASNNATPTGPRQDIDNQNNYEVTASGWYVFEHRFYQNADGNLAVAMNLCDAAGNWLFTEVRESPADVIPAEVGGNRYGWFTGIDVPDGIAVDRTVLETVDTNPILLANVAGVIVSSHETIQAAVDAASDGFRIIVADGDYAAESPVAVSTDGLTFEGGAAATGIALTLDGVDTVNLAGAADIDVTGDAGANVITGNAGANRLDGGEGADTLAGGAGDDVFVVDDAGDTVGEGAGEGTDTVEASVTHTLSANVENLLLTGTDDIDGTGNGEANAITGNGGDNTLEGLGGDDLLDGGLGADTASYASDADGVTVDLGAGTATGAGVGTDTLISIENATGGSGDDSLTGDLGANVLAGGEGDDTLVGGTGDDTLVGGTGEDTAVVAASFDIDGFAFDGGAWTLTTADGSDSLEGVEAVDFDGGVTVWLADGGNLSIQAAVAAAAAGDTILVASGAHTGGILIDKAITLLALEGPDATIVTGLGTASGSAIRIQPGVTGVAIGDTEGHGFTLAAAAGDIAALYVAAGTSGLTVRGSVLTAAGANAVLAEGGVSGLSFEGNTFDGTATQLVYINGTASVNVASTAVDFIDNHFSGTAQVGPLLGLEADGGTLSGNVFDGGSDWAALELWGTGNQLTGTEGENDFGAFTGATAIRTPHAFDLNDTPTAVSLLLDGGAAVSATGNALDNTITGNGGANVIAGGAGDDEIGAGGGADEIAYAVGDGQDIVDGGSATDTLSVAGTAGAEVYTVAAEAGGFTVDIGGDAGAEIDASNVELLSIVTGDGGDTVDLAGDFAAAGVTTVTVTGGAGSDVIDGSGVAGANVIVTGGAGDDTIVGGAGNDTAVFSGNSGDYTVTNLGAGTYEVAGADGIDTVSGIEALQFDDAVVGLGGSVDLIRDGSVVATYETIQAAIDEAVANDTVFASAGTYTETLVIAEDVTLTGEAGTVIQGGGAGNGIDVRADGVAIEGVTIQGFANGIHINRAVADLSLDGVAATGNANGFNVHNAAVLTDATLTDVTLDGNTVGLRVSTTGTIDGMTVAGGSMDGNQQGFVAYKSGALGDTSTVAGVTFLGTSFSENLNKGIYVEKLSDTVFDGILVENSGTNAAYASNNGIDINLKFGDYANIQLVNSTVTGSGVDGTDAGEAIYVSARGYTGDSAAYVANRASLTGLLIQNTIVSAAGALALTLGNIDGIQLLENEALTGDLLVFLSGSVLLDGNGVDGDVTFSYNDEDAVSQPTLVGNTVTGEVIAIDARDFVAAEGIDTILLQDGGADSDPDATGNSTANMIVGNSGANILDGLGGDDLLQGGADDDTLKGGTGDDTLDGGAGDDTIVYTVGDGTDLVDGGADEDTLLVDGTASAEIFHIEADTSNDRFLIDIGDDGSDELTVANVEHLSLSTGDGGDTVTLTGDFAGTGIAAAGISIGGDTGNDTFDASGANGTSFTIDGGAGDDILVGSAGIDTLTGGIGNDTITGGLGADIMSGGAGNDMFNATAADFSAGETIDGGADFDTLSISGGGTFDMNVGSVVNVERVQLTAGTALIANAIGGLTVNGTTGADVIQLGAGGQSVTALAGNDTITGGTGADAIDGGDGIDTIQGGGGNDTIQGGLGDDHVIGGAGDDTYYGGGGVDLINYRDATQSVTIDLANNVAAGVEIGVDQIHGFENVRGGSGHDTIIGDDGANRIFASAGGDVMNGNGGVDIYDASVQTQAVFVNLSTGTGNGSSIGAITIANIENVYGSTAADTLIGDGGNNVLWGGSGNDTLQGGGGNDILQGNIGGDTMTGGVGHDTYYVDDIGDRVIEQPGQGIDTVQTSISLGLAANAENMVLLGTGDIAGHGNGGANVITGQAGNNVLVGRGGSDQLVGLAGEDWLQGDGGLWFDGSNTSAVEITDISDMPSTAFSIELDVKTTDTSKVHALFSYATGGYPNDNEILLFNQQNLQVWIGNVAVSTGLNVADGNDHRITVTWDSATGALRVYDNGAQAFAGTHRAGYTLDAGGTIVLGQEQDIEGGLYDANQAFRGEMYGMRLWDRALTATEAARTAILDASDPGLVADLRLLDGAVRTTADATGNHTAELVGSVAWIAYADVMKGGVGNDTYIVDHVGDQVLEGLSAGIDTVRAAIDWTLGAHLENLTLIGDDDLTGTGNAVGNVITGNAGDNHLIGGDGSDTLIGGAGDDLLDGGSHIDIFDGGDGFDTVTFAFAPATAPVDVDIARGDMRFVNGAAPLETMVNIEAVVGGAGHDRLFGDAGGNYLEGGDGNDRLEGRDGDDRLEGGAGVDHLYGGAGDDWLSGGTGADWFDGGDGIDTVSYEFATAFAPVVVDLQAGIMRFPGNPTPIESIIDVENVIGGGGHDQLFGDGGGNVLTGGAGNDTLDGRGGDDRLDGGTGIDELIGGEGDDWLSGGTGADTFDGGDGSDTVSYAFATPGVVLHVDLEAGGMRFGPAGPLIEAFTSIENVEGGQWIDTILGDAGANVLDGREDNDIIEGRGGDDILIGGDGDDRFVFGDAVGSDTIMDFVAGADSVDRIDLVGNSLFTAFADVLANASQVGDDTVIDMGGLDTLTLIGVNRLDLHHDDFVF